MAGSDGCRDILAPGFTSFNAMEVVEQCKKLAVTAYLEWGS